MDEQEMCTSPNNGRRRERSPKKKIKQKIEDSEETSSSDQTNSEHLTTKPKPGRKKEEKPVGKLKKKNKEKKPKQDKGAETSLPRSGKDEKLKEVFKVAIHCMDWTKGLPFFAHPVVEVSFFDAQKGALLQRSSKERKLKSSSQDKITSVLPLMTKPFDMKKMRTLFCNWEEELVFNESPQLIENRKREVIALFHLKDLTSGNALRKYGNSKDEKKTTDWRTFAWAFLRIIGHNGQPNTGKRLRLQLFKPWKVRGVTFIDIYCWWKSGNRRKYKSSLHVTLAKTTLSDNSGADKIESETKCPPDFNSNPSQVDSTQNENKSPRSSPLPPNIKWQRNENQPFQIPNNIHLTLSTFGEGCMVVKFSNGGTKLACGTTRSVLIYDVIDNGKLLHQLRGHSGIIYDLCWSLNDRIILSCSADATVRIWKLANDSEVQTQILTHPSYVYSVKLFPIDSSLLISGCFDHVLRVWVRKSAGYTLLEELNVHLGYLTSLCFNIDNTILYSADHQGVIVAWKINAHKKIRKTESSKVLEYFDKYKINHIYGNIINHIICHPNGHRILVHTRNSQIRLVNLGFWATTQTLEGILNQKERIKSCFSPCGTYVISGSEDGSVSVWNSDNGNLVSSMLELPFQKGISCVDFHPFDHMVSVCSYEPDSPVLILNYNSKKLSANNVPLNVLPVALREKKSKEKRNIGVSIDSKKPDIKESLRTSDYFDSKIKEEEMAHKSNGQYSPEKHWKDVGKELLSKLDFILKVAAEDSSQLVQKPKKKSPTSCWATALYSFKVSALDELPLASGEVVNVIEKCNSDWWLVRNSADEEGLVPTSYLSLEGASNKRKKRKGSMSRPQKERDTVHRRSSSLERVSLIGTDSNARRLRRKASSGNP